MYNIILERNITSSRIGDQTIHACCIKQRIEKNEKYKDKKEHTLPYDL